MDKNSIKCSLDEHNNLNAIIFCSHCKIYMCNKCENFHTKLFKNHNISSIDKCIIIDEFCKEENHRNNKVKYFCRSHNKLCCGLCLCKIKDKENGQHKDCEVCEIEKIKQEKKAKLKENILNLEQLSESLETSINKIKIIIQNINEEKEKLKTKIQISFTNIRNVLNNREDVLLLEVDKIFNDEYLDEKIIRESEKLPNKVKSSLEEGKKLDNKNLISEEDIITFIAQCIYIENNINNIRLINEKIIKFNELNNMRIVLDLNPNDNQILELIKTYGKLLKLRNLSIFNDSKIIGDKIEYEINLINWINSKNQIKAKLLYRKSRDGDTFEIFHQLCDNKGPTITLIRSSEGFIFGGYNPLSWDNHSNWKEDEQSFLFSLTFEKIFRKKKKSSSIYCSKLNGPWFAFVGMSSRTNLKNMSQGELLYKPEMAYFENYWEIIPNEKKKYTIRYR